MEHLLGVNFYEDEEIGQGEKHLTIALVQIEISICTTNFKNTKNKNANIKSNA